VVQPNKPTCTGGNDPEEIHYQKDGVQSAIQRATTQTQKLQYTQISLSHNKWELNTKEKISQAFPSLLAHKRYTMRHTSETTKWTYLFKNELPKLHFKLLDTLLLLFFFLTPHTKGPEEASLAHYTPRDRMRLLPIFNKRPFFSFFSFHKLLEQAGFSKKLLQVKANVC
jgi:hypothetical protein